VRKGRITRLELERAEALLQAGESSWGLAYLARLLRQQPTNRVAAERLMKRSDDAFLLPADRAAAAWPFAEFVDRREKASPVKQVSLPRSRLRGVIDFSPDGRLLVTASKDGTARLWDAFNGEPVCKPMRHETEVLSAQFSKDGLKVVTASVDRSAKIWAATLACSSRRH
jgi:hypothetical protein